MSENRILVSIDIDGKTVPVGDLWFRFRKGKSTSSFSYHETWLSHPLKFALEPQLALSPGSFYTEMGKALFGSIGDSAPDRWGPYSYATGAKKRGRLQGSALRRFERT